MKKSSHKKTKFTQEFKQAAIQLVIGQGYSQTDAAKRLGIDPKNLSRWIQDQHKLKLGWVSPKQLTAEQEELLQLRKENKRLQMERDILKKAAAFFANESH